MKTPDEIKKGMGCCARLKFPNAYCDNCPYLVKAAEHLWECKSPEIFTDALAYIQQLEDQIRDLTKMVPKWISVEERLPKYGERVLITEGSCVFEAYRSISNKWVRSGIGWAEDVTHWMPLPEGPKEG